MLHPTWHGSDETGGRIAGVLLIGTASFLAWLIRRYGIRDARDRPTGDDRR